VGRQGGGGTLEVRAAAGIRQERGRERAPGRGVRRAGFCDVCSVIFCCFVWSCKMMHVAPRSMRVMSCTHGDTSAGTEGIDRGGWLIKF
jgi:hypothetical protein